MAGWEQLSQNPGKMAELMESFKDPEILAKAQEMLKDPQYMAAAQAKVEQIKARAQANGLLDAAGNPMPGAAERAAGMTGNGGLDAAMAAMMGGAMPGVMPGGGGGGGGPGPIPPLLVKTDKTMVLPKIPGAVEEYSNWRQTVKLKLLEYLPRVHPAIEQWHDELETKT